MTERSDQNAATTRQVLRWLDDDYTVSDGAASGEVLWTVEAPDGRTVVATAAETDRETWRALYGDQTSHELDAPGMLAALLVPLAQIGCPVFVASTRSADLVLVPVARVRDAEEALQRAGHEVLGPPAER
ncbi:ACT domain-containing protein [Aeromicrobium sp. NPDC092404]|uniref:ACT domain-containing protein n=1 Tax=Aeromicrobium sp. NPDC092404 TaxID=3154976 RepID=UPI00341BC24C